MGIALFLLSVVLIAAILNPYVCKQSQRTKVLVISFDGFRWDYYQKYNTPNLQYLAKTGVHAPFGIRATFTPMTFPSHYSIVTGLYEESHGIVDNFMYDPVFKEIFNMKTTSCKWWDGGEPIWVTARRQGAKTGVYFWPGSDVEIRNLRPNYYFPFNNKVPFKNRIETAVKWLLEENVDLALVYFDEPDFAGHTTGAGSESVKKQVEQLDDLLGFLLGKLSTSFLRDKVDLIITSDHGMTNLTEMKDHLIILENYVNFYNEVKRITINEAVTGILPREGKLDIVYNKLKNAHPHMKVYKKEEIPDRYHYKQNRRIMPLIAMADEGYLIAKKHRAKSVIGNHGYDNSLPSMRPIFFSWGPHFKKNYTTDIFDSIHIYPLLCYLIGIEPLPNNSSLDKIKHILKEIYSTPLHEDAPFPLQLGATNHPLFVLIAFMFSCVTIFNGFQH